MLRKLWVFLFFVDHSWKIIKDANTYSFYYAGFETNFFYAIFGDTPDLSDFGGYKVVYNWIKGAHNEVLDNIFNLFALDKSAIHFITCEESLNQRWFLVVLYIVGLSQESFLFCLTASRWSLIYIAKKSREEITKIQSFLGRRLEKRSEKEATCKPWITRIRENSWKRHMKKIKQIKEQN